MRLSSRSRARLRASLIVCGTLGALASLAVAALVSSSWGFLTPLFVLLACGADAPQLAPPAKATTCRADWGGGLDD